LINFFNKHTERGIFGIPHAFENGVDAMSLEIAHLGESSLPIDLDGIAPELLRDKTLSEIERTPVRTGNRTVALADLFRVSGKPGTRLELSGDMTNVHGIGAGMTAGEIHVRGDVGRWAGQEMSGGQLHIGGDASDGLGLQMTGGQIRVSGNAGDGVGGCMPGGARGMTGGEILIEGNAGKDLGEKMRRGLIVVGGNAGDNVGVNMLAGTVLVFGQVGNNAGVGMRRGTIGLFGEARPKLLPSFARGCRYRPTFLPLLLNRLEQLGFDLVEHEDDLSTLAQREYDLFHGDMLELGRGEILLPVG
jgi:formylmethanofuran dehydrogenase subunit C